MAQRAGSTTVQFSAASHVGGLTHYAARFVKLIEQAIDATAISAASFSKSTTGQR
jgi:hypothetical protein